MTDAAKTWNPQLYQTSHAFVWQFGRDLLAMLLPKPGECILDVGCGTGQLTSEIAASGAQVVGLDQSPDMIATASRNFPEVRFEVGDIAAATSDGEFDAVFSNAALHWVKDQKGATAAMARALKPGGRLVFEMGGHGNIAQLWKAMAQAMSELNVPDSVDMTPRYYPSIGEYAPLLEGSGLQLTFAVLFDRPTPLEGGEQGLRNWLNMFANAASKLMSPEKYEEFVRRIEELARPALFHDGEWMVDYRRLRMIALKQ